MKKKEDKIIDFLLNRLYKLKDSPNAFAYLTIAHLMESELRDYLKANYPSIRNKMHRLGLIDYSFDGGGLRIKKKGIEVIETGGYFKYLNKIRWEKFWLFWQLRLDVLSKPIVMFTAIASLFVSIYTCNTNEKKTSASEDSIRQLELDLQKMEKSVALQFDELKKPELSDSSQASKK